ERSVDFQRVNRKPLKIAQRRVASAKIIDRQADPNFAQFTENRDRRVIVAHRDTFGDLESEAVRVETRHAQDLSHVSYQFWILQLVCREIDADCQVRIALRTQLPVARIAASLLEHPAPQRHNQTARFRKWNELD